MAMIRKLPLAGLIGVLMAASPLAQAELYVSPVVRGTVSLHSAHDAGASQGEVHGRSTVHGQFSMSGSGSSDGGERLLRFGKNVPLFVALEHLVPSKAWRVNIEDGLENHAVSWEGGQSWEGVLKAIEEQNKVFIVVNHSEQAVGVGSTFKLASGMAHKVPRVWKLIAGKSLRDNLVMWGEQAGWSVAWSQDLPDYPVEHDVVLLGDLTGEGGVVDRLFASLSHREVPLTAKFYTGNNVIKVIDAGYEQEVKY